MAGKTFQSLQKVKTKTTKELTEEVKILKNENKELTSKLSELEKVVKGWEKRFCYKEGLKTTLSKTNFECTKCDKTVNSLRALNEHKKENHPKIIKCKHCDESFDEFWKLETHMKTHREENKFECSECGKEFQIEWRLRKHMDIHTNTNGKKCHYFNNFKTCPYEEFGCKFVHEKSEKCYFSDKCKNKLCQFQHEKGKSEYDKYDRMDDDDQFEVKEEICANICWCGHHKCFDHDQDNELMGVNVIKLRAGNDDEETYYCEDCDFKSDLMESVKNHFMLNHRDTYKYKCWECDKEVETISELKQHYGTFHYIPLSENES